MSDLKKKMSEKSVNTKNTFKEAFCLLYRIKPIGKISISEVCRKAGYNRTTFYEYYLNLDDMLLEIEDETVDYVLSRRKNIHEADFNFITELHQLYLERQIYIDALLGPHSSHAFQDRLKEIAIKYNPSMDFDTDDPLFPYKLEFRYEGALSLFRLWLQRNRDIPFDDFLKMIRDFFKLQ